MGVEIYYFSGSGNSLVVARDVSTKLNAKMTPIMSVLNQERIESEADIIGMVFPIYDFQPPEFMTRFISKIKNIQSKYLFALCTYGITPGQSLKHLEKTIKSFGGHLSLGFAVEMPQNGLGSGKITKIQQEKMFGNWKARADGICEDIENRKNKKIETSILFFNLLKTQKIRLIPVFLKFLYQVSFKGLDSLAFTSDENCTGCGTCQQICTQNNIQLVNHKPSWSNHCINCFACLNWCPNKAIHPGDADLSIKSYHHPEVEISDMIL